MPNIFRYLLIILAVIISSSYNQVNAQHDSLFDFTDSLYSLNLELIQNLPIVKGNDLFQLNPSVYRPDKFGNFYINGFRTSDDYILFDGVPLKFIEEMPVSLIGNAEFDGFDPYLKYGNSVTGFAAFEVTAPSDSFSFHIESSSTLIHKQLNDADIRLLLSGPITSGSKNGNNGLKISYSLASRLFSSTDHDPSYISRNQASDDWKSYLYNEPLSPAPYAQGTYTNALYTEANDAVSSYFNSNAAKKGFSLYGNLSVDIQKNMSVKLGSYTVSKNEIIPQYDNYFFNQENNPEQSTTYSSNYLDFEHRIDLDGEAFFKYDVQGQYSFYNSITQSRDHGDDFLAYGYVGRFDTFKSPTFEIGSDTVDGQFYEQAYILNSWDYDTLVEFTPGNINPGLAAYTSSYYSIFQDDPDGHYQNYDQIMLGGGFINGTAPGQVYGLYNNHGTVFNGYAKDNKKEMNIMANGELAFGRHAVHFGFSFRRDAYSYYQIRPVNLWGTMNALANYQINELDIENPYVHEGEGLDTIFYDRKFDADDQRVFDRRLREVLGLDPEGLEYIDIGSFDYSNNTIAYFDKDGYRKILKLEGNPFSMDLFNPDELYYNSGLGLYGMGYDYRGNKIKKDVSFEDFFTATDEDGEYTRPVGSYTPLNYSAYVDYALQAKGWSIDAGLKLDAFNSNQMVLADPFLWVEAYTVSELEGNAGFSYTVPAGIGDDYVVYVDHDFNPQQITGFRNGYDWFDEDGVKVEDPDVLDVGSGICAFAKDKYHGLVTPGAFTKNKTFINFLPQLRVRKVMNRWLMLIVQYNSSVVQPEKFSVYSDPSRFFFKYWMPFGSFLPNGSLEPERADHINAGLTMQPFKKTIVSAIGTVTYYSNLIFPYFMAGAYPVNYFTYKNADESYIQYGADLAFNHYSGRSSGFNYGLSYHLNINNNNDDEYLIYFDTKAPKNLLKGYITYNTGFGTDYAGPAGKTNYKIFESVGVGAFAQFQSGVSYAYHAGFDYVSKNLPAAAFLDLKLDKSFHFDNNRYLLDIYCIIQNVFNTEIILDVYRNSGDPDDDGYLEAPENQHEISEALSEEAYRFLYESHLKDPGHYGLPRRTTLGISFSF